MEHICVGKDEVQMPDYLSEQPSHILRKISKCMDPKSIAKLA